MTLPKLIVFGVDGPKPYNPKGPKDPIIRYLGFR